jgi:hypothetical protein
MYISALPKVDAVAVGPVAKDTPTLEPEDESENTEAPLPTARRCE